MNLLGVAGDRAGKARKAWTSLMVLAATVSGTVAIGVATAPAAAAAVTPSSVVPGGRIVIDVPTNCGPKVTRFATWPKSATAFNAYVDQAYCSTTSSKWTTTAPLTPGQYEVRTIPDAISNDWKNDTPVIGAFTVTEACRSFTMILTYTAVDSPYYRPSGTVEGTWCYDGAKVTSRTQKGMVVSSTFTDSGGLVYTTAVESNGTAGLVNGGASYRIAGVKTKVSTQQGLVGYPTADLVLTASGTASCANVGGDAVTCSVDVGTPRAK